MTSSKTTITIPVTIEREVIANALASGATHGIGYWAMEATAYIPPILIATLTEEQRRERDEWGVFVFAALTPGCHVELIEHGGEAGEGTRRRFGVDDIIRAFGVIAEKYPHHIGTILNDGDAESGDVLIQLAALGEIVYG